MCVHICKEKRKPPWHRPSPGSQLFANHRVWPSSAPVTPDSHLKTQGLRGSGRVGWGSLWLVSFSGAHPARTRLLCQQAAPHQPWQGSISKLHSCSGPSLHTPHQRHYRDIPSSLPIFPPPARCAQEALLSFSSPPSLQTHGKNNCWQFQPNSGSPDFPMLVKRRVLKCLLKCLRSVWRRGKRGKSSALLLQAGSWYVPQCRSLRGPPSETPHQTPRETWGAGFLGTAAWKDGWGTRAEITVTKEMRHSWATCLAARPQGPLTRPLCKASLSLNENSGVHILTKGVQQVFENALFKKSLASKLPASF